MHHKLTADPAPLYEVADRVTDARQCLLDAADQLRGVLASVAASSWVGEAAESHRSACRRVIAHVDGLGSDAEKVAAAARRLAGRVTSLRSSLLTTESRVRERLPRLPVSFLTSLTPQGGDDTVVQTPQGAVLVRLPVSGSVEWRDLDGLTRLLESSR